ncbi:Bug family tripartite tricarboxylate transporter substrate binding protein [Paracraurococcus lichenis]|uniref:Tripartite tricarboxylate transporter substrate binding protein n=1 Tax=Paracraurococcus lichenis TaxID=3064888 RepID=A0ABT9E624_9PROT|nr:tripartite tricarboxylate transporter substrate binding protein [Paracraurococcus sp. LOR1-02]MDO9711622.1 tripartite tricarboxylate transporter substrate binding protein [Paracraurococcus sp. LOR1-02]
MIRLLASLLLLLAAAMPAAAQIEPGRPIRLIVGYGPGGSLDLVARVMAELVRDRLGAPVVVENRTGAGGIIGSDLVAKAPPDGHTLVMGGGGSHGVTPAVKRNLPFDPDRDFTAIARVADFANVMVVSAALPVRSVQEFVGWARAQRGGVNFGSSGVGTSIHLTGELFRLRTGLEMTHVPYRGSGGSSADLRAGQIQVIFDNLPSVIGQVQAGALRALAVTSATRAASLPEVPTMAEAGIADFVVTSWVGPFGPAGLSPATLAQLSRAFTEAAASPAGQERLRALGAVPAAEDAAAFDASWRQDMARWRRVVAEAGVPVEE